MCDGPRWSWPPGYKQKNLCALHTPTKFVSIPRSTSLSPEAGALVPCEGEDATACPEGLGFCRPAQSLLSAGHIAGVGLTRFTVPGLALRPRLAARPFLAFSIQLLPAEAWQEASRDSAGSINPARAGWRRALNRDMSLMAKFLAFWEAKRSTRQIQGRTTRESRCGTLGWRPPSRFSRVTWITAVAVVERPSPSISIACRIRVYLGAF